MQPSSFRPAWWLPGPHLPTIYGRLFRRLPPAPTRPERWETPDGDRLLVHRLAGQPGTPRLVVLHGLEGGVRSHYAQGLLREAHARGWAGELIVWRTCDEPINRTRRAYHSGETTDTDFVVSRLAEEEPQRPIVMAGISLGGNVLLKWLGERGADVPVYAAAAISVPYDLARASRHIDRGFSRVYSKFFLKTLVAKTQAKLVKFPDLVDRERLARVRTLWEFDDVVTGPVHGFRDALDYYTRSSSLRYLHAVRRPTLLFNAEDDPFLPREVLDDVRAVARENAHLEVQFPRRGGHVGFVSGPTPWRVEYFMERHVVAWLGEQVDRAAPRDAATHPAVGVPAA
jgi:predicted alpha/beta-fold hydrolase